MCPGSTPLPLLLCQVLQKDRIDDFKNTDPREALLKHAQAAIDDPKYVTTAYAQNQPQVVAGTHLAEYLARERVDTVSRILTSISSYVLQVRRRAEKRGRRAKKRRAMHPPLHGLERASPAACASHVLPCVHGLHARSLAWRARSCTATSTSTLRRSSARRPTP